MKIVIIGSGNVAYHLAKAFTQNNIEISQIFGRNEVELNKISEERMANIERLFRTMNSQGTPIYKNTNETSSVSNTLNVVMIEVQPGCAKNNTCCPFK